MQINIGGRMVTIKELTVGEVREYIKLEESDLVRQRALDPVTDLMLEDLSLRDIVAMTDLKIEDIDTMTTRQLQEVVKSCREWNPGFFLMAKRAKELMERLASQISTSGLPA